jgi:PhnB protein
MQVRPYLFFDGRCDEAIAFYQKAAGATVENLMRYKDNPEPNTCMAAHNDKVMHSCLRIGDVMIFASDGRCEGKPKFDGFALTISVKGDAEAKRLFEALGEGGAVTMPLGKTFFSSSFGMLTDRFGVAWMVLVAP